MKCHDAMGRLRTINLNHSYCAYVYSSNTHMNVWGVSICEGTTELQFAEYSIESLFANIIAVINKYWSIRYQGILNIPMNINMVLRGGNKDGNEIEGELPYPIKRIQRKKLIPRTFRRSSLGNARQRPCGAVSGSA